MSSKYFVIKEDKSTAKIVADEIHRVYGDEPTELNIVFPYKEVAWCVDANFVRYGVSELHCKGNAKTARIPGENGQFKEIECLGYDCEMYKSKKCKIMGTIKFIVEGINSVGIFQIDTGSMESIQNVRSVLNYLSQTKGDITKLKFKLIFNRKVKKIFGTSQTATVPILSLVCVDSTDASNKEEQAKNNDLPATDNEPTDVWDEANQPTYIAPVSDKPKPKEEPKPDLFGKKKELSLEERVANELLDDIKNATSHDDLRNIAASMNDQKVELSDANMNIISAEYDTRWNSLK
jgi:hypothetical protein